MVSPRAFAALRLIIISNVVGCSTGRSPGLAPLRTLSTNVAARGDSGRRTTDGRPASARTPVFLCDHVQAPGSLLAKPFRGCDALRPPSHGTARYGPSSTQKLTAARRRRCQSSLFSAKDSNPAPLSASGISQYPLMAKTSAPLSASKPWAV